MEVAIIGTGTLASSLGSVLAGHGHDVVFGSRKPDSVSVTDLVETTGHDTRATDRPSAAAAGELVVLAVPGAEVADVAADLADELAGKPVVDPTNTIVRPETSLAEQVADAAPEAHVVKAFNTIGVERFDDPDIGDGTASMFFCGDDAEAMDLVSHLALQLGFDPVDAGPLDNADHLEDLARFWIRLSNRHGRNIGFALLRE